VSEGMMEVIEAMGTAHFMERLIGHSKEFGFLL
jgi:hypothetical protein